MEGDHAKIISLQQMTFRFGENTVITEKEAKQQEEAEVSWMINYAMSWIKKYQKMRLLVNHRHMPSVTASYSNMPIGSGGFHSSTESAALKNVSATEWLEYFHSKLERLPKLYQEIIKTKYLDLNEYGEFKRDDYVYLDLNLGRSYYYIKKKEALYWLGLALLSARM